MTAPSGYAADRGMYGWDEFVLTSADEKLAYLAACVGETLVSEYGLDIAAPVMREWFAGLEWSDDWYVDHGSLISIPVSARTGKFDAAFMNDFKRFMKRPDVAVLGGSDQGDCENFAGFWEHRVKWADLIDNSYPLRALKSGQWWTVFNPHSGAKLRMSFEDNPPELRRSSAPELVDIKITDYCPFNCPYCYQASTRSGNHAPLNVVERYLRTMGQSGVFEIAIGGGEPTMHPDFVEIVRFAREVGIVPNLTTKVMPENWSQDVLRLVREREIGAVAVSVENSHQAQRLAAAITLYGLGGRVNAHFVVGANNDYSLARVIEVCAENHIPLTLLGYKDIGRGKEHKQRKQYVTPAVLIKGFRLSVDTAFVEQYADVLKAADIPDVLAVPGEGRFSMYVDAVSQKAGISSYHVDTLVDYEAPQFGDMADIWSQVGSMCAGDD
jgi:MoaA/NifB/PqqE/SkfB family radical SAM enzyme